MGLWLGGTDQNLGLNYSTLDCIRIFPPGYLSVLYFTRKHYFSRHFNFTPYVWKQHSTPHSIGKIIFFQFQTMTMCDIKKDVKSIEIDWFTFHWLINGFTEVRDKRNTENLNQGAVTIMQQIQRNKIIQTIVLLKVPSHKKKYILCPFLGLHDNLVWNEEDDPFINDFYWSEIAVSLNKPFSH